MNLNFNNNASAVYQLDKNELNVIYVPVPRLYQRKHREAYLKSISDGLKEQGYKHLLLPVLDD